MNQGMYKLLSIAEKTSSEHWVIPPPNPLQFKMQYQSSIPPSCPAAEKCQTNGLKTGISGVTRLPFLPCWAWLNAVPGLASKQQSPWVPWSFATDEINSPRAKGARELGACTVWVEPKTLAVAVPFGEIMRLEEKPATDWCQRLAHWCNGDSLDQKSPQCTATKKVQGPEWLHSE